jgi:hypothetical protein
MAFDFPSSPTVGQQYSPVAGTTYTWNGVGWTLAQSSVATSVQIKIFTANGSYVPSSGLLSAIVECVGGGGGGGAGAIGGNNTSGGGGGSGGYSRSVLTAATVGASQTVAIGAAGLGVNNAAGTAGGDTSFGSLVIAKGGGAGAACGGTGSTLNCPGGAGGIAGTGQVVAAGAPGMSGSSSGSIVPSAPGGSSIFGGGAVGPTVVAGSPSTPSNASNYGSGGAGGYMQGGGTQGTGGNGSPGICIITEFIAVSAVAAPSVTTVAGLPFASANKGVRAFVTDATSITFHATAVGGGSNNVGVVSDGTIWYIG